MPCDLGYKSFDRVSVPAPKPFIYDKTVATPTVETELLAKALERALASYGNTYPAEFSIEGGGLRVVAKYRTAADKDIVEKTVDRVGRLWQAEVLAIIAHQLGFETKVTVTKDGDGEVVMVEGKKHEYLRVMLDPKNGSSVLFERFSSKTALDATKDKFLVMAQKLGVMSPT